MKCGDSVLLDIVTNIDLIVSKYQMQLSYFEKDGELFPKDSLTPPVGTIVQKFDEQITRKSIALICDYLNKFDVVVDDGIDELKCAFWCGIAIKDTLSNEYTYAIKESMSLIMTDIVLEKLSDEQQDKYSDLVTKYLNKLTIMYNQNSDKEDMGKYGIYFMFKMISEFIEDIDKK